MFINLKLFSVTKFHAKLPWNSGTLSNEIVERKALFLELWRSFLGHKDRERKRVTKNCSIYALVTSKHYLSGKNFAPFSWPVNWSIALLLMGFCNLEMRREVQEYTLDLFATY